VRRKRASSIRRTKYRKRNQWRIIKSRRHRRGGFGSARQAFTRRFIQGATQTGKQLTSELGKDIAGKLTKSALQDDNDGSLGERTQRIVKRAFNVPSPKPITPKSIVPKQIGQLSSFTKLATPPKLSGLAPLTKGISALKSFR
jgi:hypothetical protein